MGFLKRLAFNLGLVVGLVVVAAAGAVALTYLFTGKFPVASAKDEGTEVSLLLPDEITTLVREQMTKRVDAAPASELT
jgi:hypothetical protein